MGGEACKLKIILNGGSAVGYAQAVCNAAQNLTDEQALAFTDEVAYPIIKQIIVAEHALEKAHNMFLDAISYDGPRP